MSNLFVYGTLLDDEIWQNLIRRSYKRHSATLDHYQAFYVKNRNYPGLVQKKGKMVRGEIILSVTKTDFSRLDVYEGDLYERIQLNVKVDEKTVPAQVYIVKKKYIKLLDSKEWCI